jgi:hypothetical protein
MKIVKGTITVGQNSNCNWVATRMGSESDFNDYMCTIICEDDDGQMMFADFILRGVSSTSNKIALAARVLGEGSHRLKYVNKKE